MGYQQELYILRCWQKRDLAKMQLYDIKPADVAKARDQRLEEVSSGSVRREFDAISAVFTYAVKEWGLCSSNPVKQIRKPPHGKPRERRVELDEVTRIIAASKAPDFAAIVWLTYETAMRRSELLSLVWEHIDLERRIAYLPLTKNGDSRTVPLSSTAISILSKLPRRNDGKVFSKNATSLSGAFNRAVTRTRSAYLKECILNGIKIIPRYLVDIRLHDLRHEATTNMLKLDLVCLKFQQ
ncbi:site-specific integrase [Aquitalea sp. FJL05]|uniref:tyrosine-type recombinase/integrase n=1 Tax=Aquitalea sp. FJL05 TaxID=2153366 RepID=UPI001F1B5667|nr:site-specific integrase [Aquitalea sp. FJL05]